MKRGCFLCHGYGYVPKDGEGILCSECSGSGRSENDDEEFQSDEKKEENERLKRINTAEERMR